MEPLKPEKKGKSCGSTRKPPQLDIEEYERLLAERFTTDPSLPKAPAVAARERDREARLKELHRKLYGD
jgi:hypothetical protein